MQVCWRLSAGECRAVEHALALATEAAVPSERWRFRALLDELCRQAAIARYQQRRRRAALDWGRG